MDNLGYTSINGWVDLQFEKNSQQTSTGSIEPGDPNDVLITSGGGNVAWSPDIDVNSITTPLVKHPNLLTIQPADDAADQRVVISGKKSIALELNGDTDNVHESDTPIIVLSQDGGLTKSAVGVNSDNNSFIVSDTSNSIELGNTAVSRTGDKWSYTRPADFPGLLVKDNNIRVNKIFFSASDPEPDRDALDYCASGSETADIADDSGTLNTVTVEYSRVGKQVQVMINSGNCLIAADSPNISINTFIPSYYKRLGVQKLFAVNVSANDVSYSGIICKAEFSTATGDFIITKISPATQFGTGQNITWDAFTISWLI